ncbi:sulfate adenylyltransferase subunit CysD [Bernardetia sp.]|uniref:sulfate adenylyltransferase subunit CysD n=1 Tax=Bernardetia sp. TaxID=1937974 RepID=UPI0025C1FE34|nr:sulfate adenylyltransferase subunit CysD [Bernardetia sp.]
MNYNLSHLDQLEAEAIYLMRETVAQFENIALLFSGGKDSITLLHLARKAFYPAQIPFPLLHIDTGHNFEEAIEFRDYLVEKTNTELLVRYVQDSINQGKAKEETGYNASRNKLQSITLLDAIEELKLDACFGGGRRDEEKARAKERFFSHRDGFGEWNPKNQRPELWNLFNGKKQYDENFRVFPLSNWTELDVWQYIEREQLELPSLYFTHERECFIRDGVIMGVTDFVKLKPEETTKIMKVRFRTLGDATCTGAIESPASTVSEIVSEVAAMRLTERAGRADDLRSEAAMEDRKKEGYF